MSCCAPGAMIGPAAADRAAGADAMRNAFGSGAAAEHFARMVTALGGPADFLEKYEAYLPSAPVELAGLGVGSALGMEPRTSGKGVGYGADGKPNERHHLRRGSSVISPQASRRSSRISARE